MIEYKKQKIKQWNSKMMGFYNKDKVKQEIEQQEKDDRLREKIARQTFVYDDAAKQQVVSSDTWQNWEEIQIGMSGWYLQTMLKSFLYLLDFD